MATRRNTTAGPTAAFEVLIALSHDNEDYEVGDTVELTEAQALALGPQIVRPLHPAEPQQ
jgi:hypothetical protein